MYDSTFPHQLLRFTQIHMAKIQEGMPCSIASGSMEQLAEALSSPEPAAALTEAEGQPCGCWIFDDI